MPQFEPFRAFRYAPGTDLAAVIAPPYDVLSGADVDELAARDPHNIVHVDVPRGGADRYQQAAATLRAWVEGGVLVADDTPSYTLYRMRFTDAAGAARDLVGVLGGLEIVDEGAGGVLPHERTTPKASTDRLDLTRATDANLSPVWGLSLAEGLTDLLVEPGEEVGVVVVDGVEHRVERVTDPRRVEAIRTQLAADDVLIADGHHRYAVSRTYRDEVRAAGGDGPAEQTLAFVGELAPEQLSIEAIHHVVPSHHAGGPRGRARPSLRTDRGAIADAVVAGRDGGAGRVGAVATRRAGRVADATTGCLRRGAVAGRHVVGGDARRLPAEVEYQHGLTEVGAVLGAGGATAAVLIRPVSIEEIERTAREGLLMPPKSTFFTPKLRTGFVVRPLR